MGSRRSFDHIRQEIYANLFVLLMINDRSRVNNVRLDHELRMEVPVVPAPCLSRCL